MFAFFDLPWRRSSALLGIIILLLVYPAHGQDTTSTPVLTLRGALSRALESNPNLRGQRFALDILVVPSHKTVSEGAADIYGNCVHASFSLRFSKNTEIQQWAFVKHFIQECCNPGCLCAD